MTLQKRFVQWHSRMGAAGCPQQIFRHIETLYASPGRFYHTLNDHVAWCVEKLWEVSSPETNPHHNSLEFALLLHDAIMDFSADDNEVRSAEEAIRLCSMMHLTENFSREAHTLILTTKNHQSDTPEKALLLDLDLAILGAESSRYAWYESAIAKEYTFVPRELFVRGRKNILKSFLEQNSIFATRLFREHYETRARENLRKAINHLG
jgi:predicted metal-dependent HD superfamily phosphohydrolase